MDTTRRTFKVSTCGKTVKVIASSPFQAAVEAIQTKKFKSIGVLIEVIDPKSTSFYVSGVKAAKASGLMVEES